jgi:hypothetical protein
MKDVISPGTRGIALDRDDWTAVSKAIAYFVEQRPEKKSATHQIRSLVSNGLREVANEGIVVVFAPIDIRNVIDVVEFYKDRNNDALASHLSNILTKIESPRRALNREQPA